MLCLVINLDTFVCGERLFKQVEFLNNSLTAVISQAPVELVKHTTALERDP